MADITDTIQDPEFREKYNVFTTPVEQGGGGMSPKDAVTRIINEAKDQARGKAASVPRVSISARGMDSLKPYLGGDPVRSKQDILTGAEGTVPAPQAPVTPPEQELIPIPDFNEGLFNNLRSEYPEVPLTEIRQAATSMRYVHPKQLYYESMNIPRQAAASMYMEDAGLLPKPPMEQRLQNLARAMSPTVMQDGRAEPLDRAGMGGERDVLGTPRDGQRLQIPEASLYGPAGTRTDQAVAGMSQEPTPGTSEEKWRTYQRLKGEIENEGMAASLAQGAAKSVEQGQIPTPATAAANSDNPNATQDLIYNTGQKMGIKPVVGEPYANTINRVNKERFVASPITKGTVKDALTNFVSINPYANATDFRIEESEDINNNWKKRLDKLAKDNLAQDFLVELDDSVGDIHQMGGDVWNSLVNVVHTRTWEVPQEQWILIDNFINNAINKGYEPNTILQYLTTDDVMTYLQINSPSQGQYRRKVENYLNRIAHSPKIYGLPGGSGPESYGYGGPKAGFQPSSAEEAAAPATEGPGMADVARGAGLPPKAVDAGLKMFAEEGAGAALVAQAPATPSLDGNPTKPVKSAAPAKTSVDTLKEDIRWIKDMKMVRENIAKFEDVTDIPPYTKMVIAKLRDALKDVKDVEQIPVIINQIAADADELETMRMLITNPNSVKDVINFLREGFDYPYHGETR